MVEIRPHREWRRNECIHRDPCTQIPAAKSETSRKLLLQPEQIGGCGRCGAKAPATDCGGAKAENSSQICDAAHAGLQGLVNQFCNVLVIYVRIGGGIETRQINAWVGKNPATTSGFLEQGTIRCVIELSECWPSRPR
jgi:hypothetical protein